MANNSYVRVKRVGVFSAAKIFALFGLAVGVISLVLAVVISAIGGAAGFAVGLGIGIVLLIVMVVGGFVMGAIYAFLYDVIVRLVGPVRILLDRGGVIRAVDPLSYAKVSFVACLIVFGLIALFISSVLFSVIEGGSAPLGSQPAALVAGAFVFAIVVYGFVIPYVWALLYNWLAERIGGIGIVLRKGVLAMIDVWPYVKIMLALSIVIFIVERVIGGVVDILLKVPLLGTVLSTVVGIIAVVVVGLVGNALIAWFYNVIARRFGGVEIDIAK
jgi:hypothetical protein